MKDSPTPQLPLEKAGQIILDAKTRKLIQDIKKKARIARMMGLMWVGR